MQIPLLPVWKQVTAELFPGDFLDQMAKSGSAEETGPSSPLQSGNDIILQSLLLPHSWSSPQATQDTNSQ